MLSSIRIREQIFRPSYSSVTAPFFPCPMIPVTRIVVDQGNHVKSSGNFYYVSKSSLLNLINEQFLTFNAHV